VDVGTRFLLCYCLRRYVSLFPLLVRVFVGCLFLVWTSIVSFGSVGGSFAMDKLKWNAG